MNRFATSWRRGLVLGVVGAGLLTATASFAATTLTVWCWDPNFNGVTMREAGAIYAKTHPDVTLNVIDTTTQDDVRTKLQAQLLAGSTDGLPDIVLIEDDVAQKYLQSFPGAFEPLSDAIDMSKFAQYKVAAATYDGKSYSLPFDSGVAGLFYRSDYLAEAGYKAADLQDITWDDLIKIGKDVEAKTGHQMLDIDFNERGLIRMMLQSAGQWYFKEDGTPQHRRQRGAQGRARAVRQVLAGGHRQAGVRLDRLSPAASPPARSPRCRSACGSPARIKANPDQSGKWAVAPIPRLPAFAGAVHASNWGGSSWYVLATSPNKDGRHRLPQVGLGQRRRLLPEDPRRSGRRRHAARRARRRAPTRLKRSVLRRPAGLAGLLRLARQDSGRRLRHLHRRGRLRRAGATADDRPGRFDR